MYDIGSILAGNNPSALAAVNSASKAKSSLDMTDFLSLMVAEFTNQSMDATADTSDMLNQLVQMQVVQAITNITDASIMTYASSLVGKEVTLGQYDSTGKLEEVIGVVTGTGSSGGQQVIFVNGESHYLSEIMAVGRLPGSEDVEAMQPLPPVQPKVQYPTFEFDEYEEKADRIEETEEPEQAVQETVEPEQSVSIIDSLKQEIETIAAQMQASELA